MDHRNRLKTKARRKIRPSEVDLLLMTGVCLWILLLIACSTPQVQQQANAQPSPTPAVSATDEVASLGKLPLRTLIDVPLLVELLALIINLLTL